MPSCIICHLNINEHTDSFKSCKNLHFVHKTCLAEWLLHSHNCPLCSEPYPQRIIDQFKDYKDEKEREKQDALDKELHEETMKKMEEVANKVVFLKFIDTIEKLMEEEKYNEAIDKLLDSYSETEIDDNNLRVLFLLGKANLLKGRYDLAINFLFKLVKVRFDYPDGFLLLGNAYEKIGLKEKAQWAYDRISSTKK
ncbi:MAG: RING finger domain-containing protein [Candidatus Thorarchaeota archaeon]